MILGVNLTEPGFRAVSIKTYTDTPDFAEGDIPTPYGKIHIARKKENREVVLKVRSPREIVKEIVTDRGVMVTNDTELEMKILHEVKY